MPTQDVFTAIADPTRRRILDALALRECTVGELVDLVGTAQPNVSKHLKQLGRADLVRVRVDGPRRHYAVQPDRLREVDTWLETYRRTWSERLDSLEQHLDRMDDKEQP